MLAIERRNAILAKLKEDRKVVVSDLSELYNVTEETIRRDLEKLEAEGLAKKTYGGAVINESLNVELPYIVRKKSNVAGKQVIGELLAKMISDGDHIILDASSTALFVAKSIKNKKNLTVITNSIEIMIELSDRKGWKILSTGGLMKDGALSLVGYQAIRMINSFNVDKAAFSVKGIDIRHGMTDSNESEAQVKMAFIQAAKKKILAVDSSKFNKISFTKVGEIKEVDMVITDRKPSDEWLSKFEAEGIDVIFPEEQG
ncbi:MAG TPA: DeoR/GlpR transcriptional regulator [Eubacterium sp.]|nr:DeoR/GlpR transcriptional regulator [Eubacterium sp.]HAZ86586.1 DeoR/GlpR transcriptional regulator [Eubacterium sp.]